MNSDDAITSNILSDVNNIAYIYDIIKKAGIRTTQNARVKEEYNNVCIIRPYQSGKNRVTTRCIESREYSVIYDPNDIIIVGGSALNLYDYKLTELKERRALSPLEEYIKKKTSDIDIVWWPRPSTDKEIIVSQSEAIVSLVEVFVMELTTEFEKNRLSILNMIKQYIPQINNSDILNITVTYKHIRPAGVYNINIIFQIKTKLLKICDIIIHDSGSSQRYDRDGNEIKTLEFMIEDLIYSTPTPAHFNTISYLNINDIDVAVPNILQFIDQQMFAFENFIRQKDQKGFINYKRVEFIRELIGSFKLDNESNTRNYTELIEVFGTTQPEFRKQTLTEINNIVVESIFKLYKNINELCTKSTNIKGDKYITELCKRALDIINLEAYKVTELARLDRLKNEIRGKYKKEISSNIKQGYYDITRELDHRRIELAKMTPIEVYKYRKHYEANPDTVHDKIRILDDKAKQFLEIKPYLQPPVKYEFHGYAPRYPPPTAAAPFYVEASSGRKMRWDSRGFWYYITAPPLLHTPTSIQPIRPSMYSPPMYSAGNRKRNITKKRR
jgi:hypothetical protein